MSFQYLYPLRFPFRHLTDLFFLLPAFLVLSSAELCAQELPGTVSSSDFNRYNKAVRVMFYNVENLFDLEHDSTKNDADFLPGGAYNWSKTRLYKKIQNLSKVIIALGGWEAPEIIGLCEVENRKLLNQLIRQSPLHRYPYRIVHYESPDRRGIDVALLYRDDKFTLLHSRAIPLIFKGETEPRTRDILYVKGLVMHRDTVHLFINHWPSRFGGHAATDPLRCQAGKLLKLFTDSILSSVPGAGILIMGDFNDQPSDPSLKYCLGALENFGADSINKLINLMAPMKKSGAGTHAFRDFTGWEYSLLDQFIVSTSLLDESQPLVIREKRAWIFAAPFMIETTDDGAKRPLRSFVGRTYKGGYSDHFPVFLDLMIK